MGKDSGKCLRKVWTALGKGLGEVWASVQGRALGRFWQGLGKGLGKVWERAQIRVWARFWQDLGKGIQSSITLGLFLKTILN